MVNEENNIPFDMYPKDTDITLIRNTSLDSGNEHVLKLPFDQYQRYKIVADIINKFKNKKILKILDVGAGFEGNLKKFLPNDDIYFLDKEYTPEFRQRSNYIIGDFIKMDLDETYDFIVSIDTYEHIPSVSREKFISKLLNLSKIATIIAAPFDTPWVREHEVIANELYKLTHGIEYKWLHEHIQNGLPSLPFTLELIKKSGFNYTVIPNGYLPRWFEMISMYLLTEGMTEFTKSMDEIYEFYNKNFYYYDNLNPAYRQVIIVTKVDRNPDFSSIYAQNPEQDKDFSIQSEMLRSFFIKIRELYSNHKHKELREKNTQIIELNSALQAKNAHIREFETEIKRMVADVGTLQNINLNHQKTQEELSAALQAKDSQITELKSALQTRDAQITELKSAMEARDARITELTSSLQARDSQITELKSALYELQQSIIVRGVLMKYQKLVDTLYPHGTTLRRYYDGWLHWMRNAINKNKNIYENEFIISRYVNKKTKNVDIICFPIINWDFRYQRSQQLLHRFAKNGYRVFYLTVELTPYVHTYTVREIEKNVLELKLSISSKFNVYKDILSQKQVDSLLNSLNEVKRDFKIDKALSFVEFPNWEPLVSKLKEIEDWKIIYDCMDEHTDFSNVNSSVSSKEAKLFKESDVIVVTSNHLLLKAKAYRNDIVFIPNAGDFEHFNKLPENTLLENIKKPIIGYFGAIAEWFDNELIEFLAESNKNWNFVLIGRTFGSNIKNLKTFPNVHFLGEKPYKELPEYLFWFDVCIIPFKLTPLIEATHPVKFYEYLSSGKPVVSSKLPELLKYSDLCYIAENKNDFLEKIKIALIENDLEINTKRIKFAQDNTWDARYQMLISHIEQQLKIENIK